MKLNKQIISDLRKEYGDAFYLLDSKQFRSNYTELKNAFSSIYSNFNIAYSYKTNYTPRLCKIVNELGGYAEVVSEMEAALAMRIGVKENRIIWNGPIKNKEKLESFILFCNSITLIFFILLYIKLIHCRLNKRTPRSSFIVYYSTALNPDSVGASVTVA